MGSHRLLYKYWKDAAECGLAGYHDLGIPNACGMWDQCTASHMTNNYGVLIAYIGSDCVPGVTAKALQTLEQAVAGTPPLPENWPCGGLHGAFWGRQLPVYGRWMHPGAGYACDYAQTLLTLANVSHPTPFCDLHP